ncbi:transcriptional regulator [Acidithiobacillus acidisediminis]|uniref:transcriptional regulator n=1 Tax=Acidithiobacillus acidisediminis TaxID=2937799 RepID=UPI0031FEBF46
MNLISYTSIHGNRALAEALGVSNSMISQWKSGHRRVSPETAIRIEIATGGEITRQDLRPDIFGPLPTTMAEPHRESA